MSWPPMTRRGSGCRGEEYERRVRERMQLIRSEHPEETGPNGNWSGYATAEHDPGECVECDALRRLAEEDDQ